MFVTSGLAFILMAFVYVIVDAKEWWGGEPFFYAGESDFERHVTYVKRILGCRIESLVLINPEKWLL